MYLVEEHRFLRLGSITFPINFSGKVTIQDPKRCWKESPKMHLQIYYLICFHTFAVMEREYVSVKTRRGISVGGKMVRGELLVEVVIRVKSSFASRLAPHAQMVAFEMLKFVHVKLYL
mmetsp:Transcript_22355/g.54625  ORF Transcript_22355/g.54625 Transcript_22355/m.54625 type:complete len:118 (-) Transcript_22355:76-429(-)